MHVNLSLVLPRAPHHVWSSTLGSLLFSAGGGPNMVYPARVEEGVESGTPRTTDHQGTVPVFPFLPLLFLACYVGYKLWGFDGLKFCGSDDGGVEGCIVGIIEAGACVVPVTPFCPPAPFRRRSRARGEGADEQAVEKEKGRLTMRMREKVVVKTDVVIVSE